MVLPLASEQTSEAVKFSARGKSSKEKEEAAARTGNVCRLYPK